ncbi:hypothetical protein SLA2020_453400 [Shorea laevis]
MASTAESSLISKLEFSESPGIITCSPKPTPLLRSQEPQKSKRSNDHLPNPAARQEIPPLPQPHPIHPP